MVPASFLQVNMLTCVLYFLCLQSIQDTVTGLTKEELFKFKMRFYQWEQSMTLQQVMEGDILDFVDRILEILGKEALLRMVHTVLIELNI